VSLSTLTVVHNPAAADWDAFVTAHPEATGYHLWTWRHVFEDTFGHEACYLAAFDTPAGASPAASGRNIIGILPLVGMKSLLFGRFGVSLPFLNYGGVVASDESVARALLTEAIRLAQARRWKHLEIRHLDQRFTDLEPKRHRVGMYLRLADNETKQWDAIDRKVRNQVRKAQKSNFTTAVGGAELVDEFYQVFARNMRDLGTPVYSRRLFADVARLFPDRVKLYVVRDKSTPIAAGLTFGWRSMVEVPWASSLKEYRTQCPNMLLYWEMLRTAVNDGHQTFDFGRSIPDEGTYHFKRQWGAEPRAMCWEYWLPEGRTLPDQSPKNPKFAAAISLWQRLPVALTTRLGPHVVRHIP
jgi:FemAB-related protein (PEP-CTERM system-associated)